MSEQQPGVEAVLAECGLDALSELEKTQTGNVIPFRSPRDIADLETKLRRLPELLGGADALRIAAVREALLLKLRSAKTAGAAKLVNLALQPLVDSAPHEAEKDRDKVLSVDDEPWPHPVNGADLLDELGTLIEQFLIVPEGAATAVPLWIVHTHLMDCWDVSPILAVTSPTKQCGKTTLLELLSGISARGLPSSNVTAAAIFRTVDKYKPTLILDEADTWMTLSDELRGILNSGHKRSGAWITRNVGDNHEPKLFSTWAAKALALIRSGRAPDTVMDRSIQIRMRRRTRAERVKRLRERRLRTLCEPLRRKCARWAADHRGSLAVADPNLPDVLTDRQQDNWAPLVAIADEAGGAWPEAARKACLILSGAQPDQDDQIGVELLADIRTVFDEKGEEAL